MKVRIPMSNLKVKPKNVNLGRLAQLLLHPRGEPISTKAFMKAWFSEYTCLAPTVDKYGNFVLVVGDNPRPTTMFTAHYDTVDNSKALATPLNKKLLAWVDKGVIGLHPKATQAAGVKCLGADDGAGCEVLVCMAEAGVPGLYIWFADEEKGTIGSTGYLYDNIDVVDHLNTVVSFDRRGTTDIVTTQIGFECCSNEFVNSIKNGWLTNHTAARGSYTDSATFMDKVSECTNISVGYALEHTATETLNIPYLDWLVGVALTITWDTLPTKRQPSQCHTYDLGYGYGGHSYTGRMFGDDTDDTDDTTFTDLVYDNPEEVIEFIKYWGLEEELKSYIKQIKEVEYYDTI